MIKLTKAHAKEPVSKAFTVILAPAVEDECVEQGLAGGHSDAALIGQNLKAGLVSSGQGRRVPRAEALLRSLGLSDGEADALRLFMAGRADIVVSDDRRFLQVLKGLEVPRTTPAALLARLVARKSISRQEGLRLLDRMAPLISEIEFMAIRRSMEGG